MVLLSTSSLPARTLAAEAASALQFSSATPLFDDAAEAHLVDLINQARKEHGLPPLTVDPRLTQAARQHTELMVRNGDLSHQFPGEPPLQNRFADKGLPSDREGENVDLDQNAVAAHEALMHSPPHRRNILDPDYNVVGVGVLQSGPEIYVTEDFARRLPELSEPEAEAAVQSAINRYQSSHGHPSPVRKAQPRLRTIACTMAQNDAIDSRVGAHLPGVHTVFAWTAGDPAKLPKAIAGILSSGLPSGYALGACFAPSVSHPGGLYWIVMVGY